MKDGLSNFFKIFLLAGAAATSLVDANWNQEVFVPTVQKRGAAVIAARKLSSAMSAAKVVILGCKCHFSSLRFLHLIMFTYFQKQLTYNRDLVLQNPQNIII